MRHPQYIGFVVIMTGFILQWPTLLTLAMFPVLTFMFVRLALTEEHEAERQFGAQWRDYAGRTPRFVPRLGGGHDRPAASGPVGEALDMEDFPAC